ncbi:MAG TPA: hypothetical protein VF937_03110 [Chloroflexota bacterium]
MLFAEFTQPFNIAALLVEAALLVLAFSAASLRVLVRPVRWLARGLAILTAIIGVGFGAGMLLELLMFDLPFVVPEAPLGTYAQMTQLGLLVGIVSFALTAVGSALAFRRPGTGGLVLVLVGLYGLLEAALKQDPTLPASSLAFGMLLNLLVLVVGALVLASRPSMRRPSTTARGMHFTAHGAGGS